MSFLEALDRLGFGVAVALQGDGPGAQLLMRLADQFVGNAMLKMAPLVLLLLYVWLQRPDRMQRGVLLASPELVVRGVAAIVATLAVGRLLQLVLPMRPRPRFAHPEIAFPPTDFAVNLDDWSSMPSDHAMLVAAIAAVIWMRSRPLALVAFAWGLLVSLSRVYVGLHHASDILVGYLLGLALAAAVLRVPLPAFTWTWLWRLEARRPALVILGLFALGWGIGENFVSARTVLSILRKAVLAEGALALNLAIAVAAVILLAAFLVGGFVRRRGQAVRLRAGQAD